jgi:hypothetical protein
MYRTLLIYMKKSILSLLVLSLIASEPVFALEEDDFPERVRVLPVFFVPLGQPAPTQTQIDKLQKHVTITQQRYSEMLGGRDTFEIEGTEPHIVRNRLSLPALKTKVEEQKFSAYMLALLFSKYKVNRFNCPYIFLVVIMNPQEAWPTAGGRTINLGFNNGGGIALLSSNMLDADKSIQGCIEHELGHAMGLVHVDCYGYDQYANKSIMSYNKENYWTNFTPPKEPGIMIPEDIRILAMNKRVFPDLYYDPERDVPEGSRISGKTVRLSFDTTIPGQKAHLITVSTNSGEANDTKVDNVVHTYMEQNKQASEGIGLVSKHMWMSEKAEKGWIDIQLTFPIAVRMNRICVHSQCGGANHPVMALRVESNTDGFVEVARRDEALADEEYISFSEVKAKQWRLHLLPGESGQVVIRGLRFYSSRGEFFCQRFPIYLMTRK